MRRSAWLVPATIVVAGLTPVVARGDTSPEARFVQLVNEERASRGLSTLRRTDALDAIAERHSNRMRRDADLYHNGNLENEIPGDWDRAGENVGVGFDVEGLHVAFMDSPSHRSNILSSMWDEVGLGVVVDEAGDVYVTEVFVDRGKRASSSKPKQSASPKPSPKPADPKPDPKPTPPPSSEPEPEPEPVPTTEPKHESSGGEVNRAAAVETLVRIVTGL